MSAKEKEVVSTLHRQIEHFIHKELQSHRKKHVYDPLSHKEAEIKHQAVENLDHYLARLKTALKILVQEGLFNKNAIHPAENISKEEIKKGILPYQSLKFSNETLLDAYRVASSHFERGDFTGASNIFLLLSFLNPLVASFWIGLGMAEELQENFEPAISAYLTAAEMNKKDLQPIFHSARCLNKMKQPEKAKELLELAMAELKDSSAEKAFKSEAQRFNLGV